jgi:nucleotide-binding universal stress UspA family protein
LIIADLSFLWGGAMYEKILVPLDGSNLAEAILPHVEGLAHHYGSSVILLQVIELPHLIGLPQSSGFDALPEMTPAQMTRHVSDAEHYLEGLVTRLGKKGIVAVRRVEFGPIVASIMRAARQENVNLIAMASHGRGGLTDVYYGSVAAGVLQRIDRPLLIVRANDFDSSRD